MSTITEITKKTFILFVVILLIELVIFFSVNLSILIISIIITAILVRYYWIESTKNDKTKDQFIEIATHKFRTPISVIEWSADALETEIDITQRREEVKKIRNSLEKLKEIIDTLVGVTEVTENVFYHFEQINFRVLIEGVLGDTLKKKMEEKAIKFNLNLPLTLPFIYADNRRIEFVLKSLLENAVTYTTSGGQIDLNVKEGSSSILFSIKDTGIGINKGDLSNIFTSFYRTKEAKLFDTEGMGLSLYTSKKIIDKHNGKIWAESEGKGKGTTFFIEFKLDEYKQIV